MIVVNVSCHHRNNSNNPLNSDMLGRPLEAQ